jgi:hypothetical protein
VLGATVGARDAGDRESGGRGGSEINLRWSAVFRRDDGEWKVMQIHASVAIPDEELLGRDSLG